MRALAAGVLGLLVGSRALGEEARAVVHLFPAPDAGGAVQMAHTGAFAEIWFPQPNSASLARVNADGSLTERHLPDSREPAPRDFARHVLRRSDHVHGGRDEPDRHLRHRAARSRSTTSRRPRATLAGSPASTRSGSRSTTGTRSAGFNRVHPVRWSSSRSRPSLPGPSGSPPRSRTGPARTGPGSPRTWPTRSGGSTRTA